MSINPNNYPGLAACSDSVALDKCTVDQAYLVWKKLYPFEYNSLGNSAWTDFRMAVSQRVGRGIAVNEKRWGRKDSGTVTLKESKN